MKVLQFFSLPLWLMPHPKPNPRLMLMPLLMPGTLTMAIPTDTMGMVDTMADGADTTVDTTDILDTMDTVDGGSAMLKPMLNPKVMPLSILMDTLTDTPALTTLMLITTPPLSIPL